MLMEKLHSDERETLLPSWDMPLTNLIWKPCGFVLASSSSFYHTYGKAHICHAHHAWTGCAYWNGKQDAGAFQREHDRALCKGYTTETLWGIWQLPFFHRRFTFNHIKTSIMRSTFKILFYINRQKTKADAIPPFSAVSPSTERAQPLAQVKSAIPPSGTPNRVWQPIGRPTKESMSSGNW